MIAEHPRLEAAILGGVLGLLAASATLAWETAWISWLDLGLPGPREAAITLGEVCGAGFALGAVLGAFGLTGSRWAVVAAGGFAGWALGPVVGLPSLDLALAAAFTLAVGTGVRRSGRTFAVVAASAWTFFALVVPVVTHVFLAPLFGAGAVVVAVSAVAAVLVGLWVRYAYEPGIFPVAWGLGALGTVGWIVAAPMLAAGPAAWPMADRPGTPVVLVTLRGGGAARYPMPALEAWTRETLAFSSFSARVEPDASIASVLTGVSAEAHRGDRQPALRSDMPTLAERLVRGHYATAAIAGASMQTAQRGLFRGFDRYVELPPIRSVWFRPGGRARTAPDPFTGDASATALAAGDFVRRQVNDRWFLWVDFTDLGAEPVPSVARVDRAVTQFLRNLPRTAVVWVVATPDANHPRGALWVRDPRTPPAVVDRPVADVDVAPAILARLYFEVPESLHGRPFPELGAPDSPLSAAPSRGDSASESVERELWHWAAKSGRFLRPPLER